MIDAINAWAYAHPSIWCGMIAACIAYGFWDN